MNGPVRGQKVEISRDFAYSGGGESGQLNLLNKRAGTQLVTAPHLAQGSVPM